ncbi:hypothetical protein ELQ35_00190 [Peribacillus cavernae]|uniref:Uncharacterized protein n=1 Tax=Peribacillus cavernae TaxID=1674310 RepID=A0A433HW64_9BACI|nr:hypothetical protein [Peribacillus cavernae]MDQ0217897.1 hypothetical protein [Peribacillus cavernae]RUQ32559.1 hypothetical protein ELQ35_00190 [Peribacillus cavernae]
MLIPLMWEKLTLKIYLIGSVVWCAGILFLGFADNLPVYFVGVLIVAIGVPVSCLINHEFSV